MRNAICYHRGCPDGFGAAWWLQRHLHMGDGSPTPAEVDMVPCNWDDELPDQALVADHVWCVDYCFDGPKLRALIDAGKLLTIFDHHQTTENYLRAAELCWITDAVAYSQRTLTGEFDIAKVHVVLDKERSGVGIVAEVVAAWRKLHAPEFVWNLQDRDLWRFLLSDTRDVFAAVTARPYTIEAWDALAEMPHEALVAEGKGINLYRDQLIESVAASVFWITVGGDGTGRWVPCASSPYFIGSDVAGLLAERYNGIGAYVILHNDRVQVGLRSRNDGPDVAELAQYHGGGGHKHASGLTLDWDDFRRRVWDNYPDDAVVSAAATPGHPPGSASPHTASRTDSS
jgi:hypothetical protein